MSKALKFLKLSDIRHVQFPLGLGYLKTVHTRLNNYDAENVNLWESNHNSEIWWNDKIDGRWISNKEPIIYPKGKEWIQQRNDIIQRIRDKFTTKNYKNRNFRYGGRPEEYISRYHKELFLEIVTALGLPRQSDKVKAEKIEAMKYTDEVDTDQLSYSLEDLDKCQKQKEEDEF
jgi:hypothetical protein